MTANWQKTPDIDNNVEDDLVNMQTMFQALTKGRPDLIQGIESGMVRFNKVNGKYALEQYDGAKWNAVPLSELAAHNADDDAHQAMLDKYVRAYGLGSGHIGTGNVDANTLTKAGFYNTWAKDSTSFETLHLPYNTYFSIIVTNHFEPNWVQQFAMDIIRGRMFVRRTDGSNWLAWQEIPSSITNDPNGTSTTAALSQKGGKAILDSITRAQGINTMSLSRSATAKQTVDGRAKLGADRKIIFPVAFADTAYTVSLTMEGTAKALAVGTRSTGSLVVNGASAGDTVNYIIIGQGA